MQRTIQFTILLSISSEQMLRLFNFVLRLKQQSLIEYWFKQLLIMILLTSDNLNEEDKLEYIPFSEEQSALDFQLSTPIELFGIYTHEFIQLLHEKFDQTTNFLSLSTFHFLSIFIRQSLPICIQCLLHENSNIRVSIARLLGRTLNIQSDDLIKFCNSLQDHNSQDMHKPIVNSLNLIDDQERTVSQVESIHYLLEREKKRSKSQIPFRVIKRTDFQELITHLETSTHIDESSKNESNYLDTIKDLISECSKEFQHLIPNRQTLPSLVQTKTMLNNRKRIIECIRTPIHLLLQGETGVGKSSLILDVAADLKKPLIRFNLSSKTDIAGLFGSVKLKTIKKSANENQQEIELDYEEGPFTTAYRYGHWLLLDEMNLAPPNVFSSY
ncbi:unnamed protein product [Didymodactylos carnosus]|uniref:ATPase dynein-related AAA domain-containing protein n=1 Tax=Didymodactylos carnosus TaxID=1234261 RepID=A0A8S2Y2N6_9BILA|nr:unnamed protein product [Didymodactylos carnosus]